MLFNAFNAQMELQLVFVYRVLSHLNVLNTLRDLCTFISLVKLLCFMTNYVMCQNTCILNDLQSYCSSSFSLLIASIGVEISVYLFSFTD